MQQSKSWYSMSLENTKLSERSQTQEATYCVILSICNFQNGYIHRVRK